jgi:t-SNARE complex subunit (syntaxin)
LTRRKVVQEFQNNLTTFQGVQQQALEKQKSTASAARAALVEGPAHGEEGAGQAGDQQSQEQLRLASQDEVEFQESLIVEREAEIRNIEQGVTELNELFLNVSQIVTEQGDQIDLIAEHVDDTRNDTRGAHVELRSAAKYQKNARSKACILLLILAVILTIVILAVLSP